MASLRFHPIHGDNIRLSNGDRKATRFRSFSKAVAFSNRPIFVGEQVRLRLSDVQEMWNGVLRLGITNKDPAIYGDNVPKYVCPDITIGGYCWAKAVPDRLCTEGSVLHFLVRENGEMFIGSNGVLQGLYLNGINTTLPMYVVIDVYGNTLSVEFVPEEETFPIRSTPRQVENVHSEQQQQRQQLQAYQRQQQQSQRQRSRSPSQPQQRDSPRNVGALTVKLPPPKETLPQKGCAVAAEQERFGQNTTGLCNSTSSTSRAISTNECCVCMHQSANCAVYPCGHVCMCHECGRMTWSRQGVCPICRGDIKDIVRLYLAN